MGPGLGGPGETDAQVGKFYAAMLQWGRALEGPERFINPTITGASSGASMGPGLGGPGEPPMRNQELASHELQWGRALEGPERELRLMSVHTATGFNGAGPWRARRALRANTLGGCAKVASMGPGLGGPGEEPTRWYIADWAELQWGRALEGPERWPCWRYTAEGRCFNGAGPWRARRAFPDLG